MVITLNDLKLFKNNIFYIGNVDNENILFKTGTKFLIGRSLNDISTIEKPSNYIIKQINLNNIVEEVLFEYDNNMDIIINLNDFIVKNIFDVTSNKISYDIFLRKSNEYHNIYNFTIHRDKLFQLQNRIIFKKSLFGEKIFRYLKTCPAITMFNYLKHFYSDYFVHIQFGNEIKIILINDTNIVNDLLQKFFNLGWNYYIINNNKYNIELQLKEKFNNICTVEDIKNDGLKIYYIKDKENCNFISIKDEVYLKKKYNSVEYIDIYKLPNDMTFSISEDIENLYTDNDIQFYL